MKSRSAPGIILVAFALFAEGGSRFDLAQKAIEHESEALRPIEMQPVGDVLDHHGLRHVGVVVTRRLIVADRAVRISVNLTGQFG